MQQARRDNRPVVVHLAGAALAASRHFDEMFVGRGCVLLRSDNAYEAMAQALSPEQGGGSTTMVLACLDRMDESELDLFTLVERHAPGCVVLAYSQADDDRRLASLMAEGLADRATPERVESILDEWIRQASVVVTASPRDTTHAEPAGENAAQNNSIKDNDRRFSLDQALTAMERHAVAELVENRENDRERDIQPTGTSNEAPSESAEMAEPGRSREDGPVEAAIEEEVTAAGHAIDADLEAALNAELDANPVETPTASAKPVGDPQAGFVAEGPAGRSTVANVRLAPMPDMADESVNATHPSDIAPPPSRPESPDTTGPTRRTPPATPAPEDPIGALITPEELAALLETPSPNDLPHNPPTQEPTR